MKGKVIAHRHFVEYYVDISELKKHPGIILKDTSKYALPTGFELASAVSKALDKLLSEKVDDKPDADHPLADWKIEEGADGKTDGEVHYLWLNFFAAFDNGYGWFKIKEALGLPDDIIVDNSFVGV